MDVVPNIPAALPLAAAIPEVAKRELGTVLPRLSAGVSGVREETVGAANSQVQDKVELEFGDVINI